MKYTYYLVVLIFIFVPDSRAQSYIGSEMCGDCHMSRFIQWSATGHANNLIILSGSTPVYPFQYVPGIPNVVDPPEVGGILLGWDDVSIVVGGFYWKALFLDQDGYIICGDSSDSARWNVFTREWVEYHPGEHLQFDCGNCHSTAYDSLGNMPDYPGIVGYWEEPGIGCEECHGPGYEHHMMPSSSNITIDQTAEFCGRCHSRNNEGLIEAENGWIKSNSQFDEFIHSPHAENMECVTCHNVHKSVIYNQGGIKTTASCEDCHSGYQIAGKENLSCEDCHIPKSALSAVVQSPNEADVSSHQFRIWAAVFPKDSMFYFDNGTFVKTDMEGQTYGNTLDLVCLKCHPDYSLEEVYPIAENIHQEGLSIDTKTADSPQSFILFPVSPNPFNSQVKISFYLPYQSKTHMEILNINGEVVFTALSEKMNAGYYDYNVDFSRFASGLYFCRLTTPNAVLTGKMVHLK